MKFLLNVVIEISLVWQIMIINSPSNYVACHSYVGWGPLECRVEIHSGTSKMGVREIYVFFFEDLHVGCTMQNAIWSFVCIYLSLMLMIGCTMHNAQCHLTICLYYPSLMLVIWCKLVLKYGVWSQWGSYHGWCVGDVIDCIHDIWCGVGSDPPNNIAMLIFLFCFLCSIFLFVFLWFLVLVEKIHLILFGAIWPHEAQK